MLAQRRGIVFVFSYLGTSKNRKTNGDSFMKATQMFRAIPVNSRGLHACMNPNKILEMFHHFRTFWEKDSRLRIRIHQGTLTECKYSLMTFGLPTHCLPLDDDLSLRRESQLQWMERRREQESGTASFGTSSLMDENRIHTVCSEDIAPKTLSAIIVSPSRKDVLFGRGRPIQDHPGNKLLNSLVESMRNRYENLQQRSDKTMLSQMIVSKVKNAGGRFLKLCAQNGESGGWEEANDAEAQAKVSHAFRSLKQLQKLKGQQTGQQQAASLVQLDSRSTSTTPIAGERIVQSPQPTLSSIFYHTSARKGPDHEKQNQWTNL